MIGAGQPCFVIAEIGINHNGDLAIAKKLIAVAAETGCDAVKFQKRTVDVVYTRAELEQPRASPYGTTNGELKRRLELDRDAYDQIATCCRDHGIQWSASCWDEASVDFLETYAPPFYKIASPSLTDAALLAHHRAKDRPIVLSTGMSTLEEIDRAVEILGTDRLVLLHCTSSYPSQVAELNLRCIASLRARYGVPVGYSGHERGIATTIAAVALGACAVERHITLDRSMWGSDQAASIEPNELAAMVTGIREVEAALGDGIKRVYPSEVPVMKKLRRFNRA